MLHSLPVEEDELENVQPFGATVFAHGAGNLYDYCQNFHCGIDFFAEWGTSVQAGVFGFVIGINEPFEGPFNIVIKSGDYIIKYGHLDGSELPIEIGDWVTPETTIGYVGNMTGDPIDENVHIHFEVRSPTWGGLTHNPETIMTENTKQEYRDFLSNQTDYPGGQYYNSRRQYVGLRYTSLPSERWQTPNTIRRVSDDSTLWP